jgi:hypothetical protein
MIMNLVRVVNTGLKLLASMSSLHRTIVTLLVLAALVSVARSEVYPYPVQPECAVIYGIVSQITGCSLLSPIRQGTERTGLEPREISNVSFRDTVEQQNQAQEAFQRSGSWNGKKEEQYTSIYTERTNCQRIPLQGGGTRSWGRRTLDICEQGHELNEFDPVGTVGSPTRQNTPQNRYKK